MKRLCVIGSLNVDLVTSVDRFPKVGESIFSKSFEIFTGGKGANQAFALGRLGADVLMVGKTGDTFYGPQYVETLEKNNVNCDGVSIEKNTFPGAAIVAVDKDGNNILFVYPGANAMVSVDYVKEKWDLIAARDIFLFQLEIPLETNLYAMKRLKEAGKCIIFDPAPAKELPGEIYGYADYITPNETELESLSGLTIRDEEDIRKAAHVLIDRGASKVIAKAGKNGAYLVTEKEFVHIGAYKVKAVDPTAAGDSFNAALAFSLAQDKDIYESIRFANAVAGLSTTSMGAQTAMPTLEQVKAFLESQQAL